jgi:DNA invertase Pin-like site-specific DNA recombinase
MRRCLGVHNPKAKLTEEDVRLIRELAKEGIKRKLIAEKFEVTTDTVRCIVNYETWSHVA